MAIGKFTVPITALTPADRLREALDKAERRLPTLKGLGPQSLELLYLFDYISGSLNELAADGVDVRAEQARFDSLQSGLNARRGRFLREAGAMLAEERALAQPDRARWWWFLDEAAAQQRRTQMRRLLVGSGVGLLVCLLAWFIYDRFIAPPPEVRKAYQLSSQGETLASAGDWQAALVEFDAALALTPDDPTLWIWKGVIHTELDEPEQARQAFDQARSLSSDERNFLINRSLIFLRAGDLDSAAADAEQAVAENPEWGQAYYARASVYIQQQQTALALQDLEKAADLAQAAGDTQLEAMARTQRAMLLQLPPQIDTPAPTETSGEAGE